MHIIMIQINRKVCLECIEGRDFREKAVKDGRERSGAGRQSSLWVLLYKSWITYEPLSLYFSEQQPLVNGEKEVDMIHA